MLRASGRESLVLSVGQRPCLKMKTILNWRNLAFVFIVSVIPGGVVYGESVWSPSRPALQLLGVASSIILPLISYKIAFSDERVSKRNHSLEQAPTKRSARHESAAQWRLVRAAHAGRWAK